jgi:hypothetical protein
VDFKGVAGGDRNRGTLGGETRREKSLRNGVNRADAVVWAPFITRSNTSWSLSRVNRTIAHRDWIGSMIFSLALHASAKRVVLE